MAPTFPQPGNSFAMIKSELLLLTIVLLDEFAFGVTRISQCVIGHGPPITATQDESEINWKGDVDTTVRQGIFDPKKKKRFENW